MAMDYVTLFLLEEQIIIIAVAGWQALETHTSRATGEGGVLLFIPHVL